MGPARPDGSTPGQRPPSDAYGAYRRAVLPRPDPRWSATDIPIGRPAGGAHGAANRRAPNAWSRPRSGAIPSSAPRPPSPTWRTRARFWSAKEPLLITKILIGMNLAMFIGILIWSADPGALSGAITNAHLNLGLSREVLEQRIVWQSDDGTRFVTEPHGWYRLITSGFLHFGIVHIGLNMFFLWVLGPMLEPALGRVRFILLYIAALLGGSLGVILLDKGGISAGASGAVFGLLAAAAIGQWRRGINPLTTGIGATLLMNLVITFAIPGISIGGHIGGIVARRSVDG